MLWADSTTPAAHAGYSPLDLAMWQTLVKATNERYRCFFGTAYNGGLPFARVPIAGCKVDSLASSLAALDTATENQDADPATHVYGWGWLQRRIEALFPACVVCADDAAAFEYVGQRTRDPALYDAPALAKVFKLITGGHFTTWPRATKMPAHWSDFSDGAYSAGYLAEHDIVGPWLPYVACRLLDYLRWTLGDYDWGIPDTWTQNQKVYGDGAGYGVSGWGVCTTVAGGLWGANGMNGYELHIGPYAYSSGGYAAPPPTGGTYAAQLARLVAQLTATGTMPTGASGCVAQGIVRCVAPPGDSVVFDACGQTWASLDYQELGRVTLTSNTPTVVGVFNSLDAPPWCDSPSLGVNTAKGFTTSVSRLIQRWESVLTYCRADHTV